MWSIWISISPPHFPPSARRVVILVMVAAFCQLAGNTPERPMSNYLFIPGGWHGAWCWNQLVPLMEKRGHRVIAVDLPSHGRDKTPTAKVTMKDYVAAVVTQLDALPEPVVLVGHS